MEGFAFEASVLSFMVARPALISSYGPRMREYPFRLSAHKTIYKIIEGASKVHGKAPTYPEAERIIAGLGETGNWPSVQVAAVLEAAKAVWATEATGVTGEEIRKFVAVGEAEDVAKQLDELRENPKELIARIPSIRARLDDITQDYNASSTTGLFLFSRDFERATGSVNELYTTAAVPCGWPLLNDVMLGGFRPGEVSIIMAIINAGKTLAAINMSVDFWRMGKKVLFVANDATEAEMAERVFACASGVPIQRDRLLSAYRQEIRDHIPVTDNLCLEVWPPKRRKVSEIRALIDRLEGQRGFRPDIVIADSGDLFIAESKGEAARFEMTDVFYEQVAMSRELDVAWIATTQANRDAFKALRDGQAMGMEHVGEALGKLQPVGNVFGIMQTMAEKVRRTFRLGLLKLRRPEGVGTYLRFFFDPWTQRISPDPEQRKPWPMWRKDGSPVNPHEDPNDAAREETAAFDPASLPVAGDAPLAAELTGALAGGGRAFPGSSARPPQQQVKLQMGAPIPILGTGNPGG